MERPLDSSWELADSLMQTLSAPLPPDSPVAASYRDMMHQLKADVTSALIACTSQGSMQRDMQLLPSDKHFGDASSSTGGVREVQVSPGRPKRHCRVPSRYLDASVLNGSTGDNHEDWSNGVAPLDTHAVCKVGERDRSKLQGRRCKAASDSSGEDGQPDELACMRKSRQKAAQATGHSSSGYRGVSRHRQLYLGGFENEKDAAAAYDIAAVACKGLSAPTNFGAKLCEEDLKTLEGASKEEIVAFVRRRSSAFSRGRSAFRGVSGHAGRWEARIGCFEGKKNVSFGHYDTEEEAARQYDRALIIEKGRGAKSNFRLADYEQEMAAFQELIDKKHGHLRGLELEAAAASYRLPLDMNAGRDEHCREVTDTDMSKLSRHRNACATIIFAQKLQKALL